MKIYCDGSGDNGKTSGYCVIRGSYTEHKTFYAPFTNNEMEWLAMIRALEIAKHGDTIFSDSQLVVYQLLGRWKVKQPRLKPFAEKGKKLLTEKPAVIVRWVPREQNDAGHYIEDRRR
jgi:ribonuclease HI